MTRSVYIVGGAGVGKSTFTGELLDLSNRSMSPLEDFHSTANARGSIVTLRGHRVGTDGVYLGLMRDAFPGSDGLDRASSITGEEWLETGGHKEFDWILSEGSTLATRRFLGALKAHTDLLVVHLHCNDEMKAKYLAKRGSKQDPQFVAATATRSVNLCRDVAAPILVVDTGDQDAWVLGLELCSLHLGLES